ncbi:MAG: DUF2177 family protein [Alphaproteobacteria bacterium]|nr:DUF2177 family protein [Alphaproteobacteria bacterium]
MAYLIAYLTILLVFGVIDAIWLSQMATRLYKPILGDMLVDNIRIMPAVIFYLAYPAGIVHFAVMPALRDGTALTAFTSAALLGALCYATYDLTNYATLKNWTWQVTVIDIAYGALTAGVCAALAFVAVQTSLGR